MAAKFVIILALFALANAGVQQQQEQSPEVVQLRQNWDSLLVKLSGLTDILKNAAEDATGQAKQTLEQARQQVEQFRRSHPEVEQQANVVGDQVKAVAQVVAQNAQKLGKEIQANAEAANQQLAPKITQAIDDFSKKAAELHQKIQDAAKQ